MFTKIWLRLSDHGIDDHDEIEQAKLHRLANQTLAFFVFLIAYSTIEGLLVLPFLLRDGFTYEKALPYVIAQALLLVCLLLSYHLIAKSKNVAWVQLAHFAGLFYILAMSLMLGLQSDFHLLLIALAPLPFFFYRAMPTSILLLSQFILWIFLVFAMWWHGQHAPLVSVSDWYLIMLRYQSVSVVVLSISICTYYLWRQNDTKEKLVIARGQEIAMAHSKLKEQNDIMQLELDFAQAIQADIFPTIKQWQQVHFAYEYRPLAKVSGDYFDIFTSEKQVLVVMVDVSGHGVPAALITMLAKRLFGDYSLRLQNPSEILAAANLELVKQLKTSDYLTAFALTLDQKGILTYANGGHCQPLLIQENTALKLDTNGPPLGIVKDMPYEYEDKSLQLKPGDSLHIYTDGITEQANHQREQFGSDRLQNLLVQQHSAPLEVIHQAIFNELEEHRQNSPIEDDISLLSLRVNKK